jgi:6-phosphogluconolactonase/glucosamine-6-phosphate isomerase/deaminase
VLDVEIVPDAAAAAKRGAEYAATCAREAVADHGRFTFAVSGGHAPWAMFEYLYGKMPREKVTIWQVDERIAPEDDPERARHVLWLITGEDTVDALRRLRAGDRSIPAGQVAVDRAIVIADAAAAGERES